MNNNEGMFNQSNNDELISQERLESNDAEVLDKQINIENENLASNMEEIKKSLEDVGGLEGLKSTMENMSPDRLSKIKNKINSVYEKMDDNGLTEAVCGGLTAASILGFLVVIESYGGMQTDSLAELIGSDLWAKAVGIGAEALAFAGGVYSLGISAKGVYNLIKNKIKPAELAK